MQERSGPEYPLWLRACSRLLCGMIAAALLGFLVRCCGGDQTALTLGTAVGMICGLACGEQAIAFVLLTWL